MLLFWSFVMVIGLTGIHLGSKSMTFLDYVPRSKILSIAGGISVSYVFVHILPELAKHQENLNETEKGFAAIIDHHLYVLAMAGLVLFYALEKLARTFQSGNRENNPSLVFWIHIISFSIYNALIGYLLIRGESDSLKEMIFYFLALAVHFISNDHGLRQTHEKIYDRFGRWILAFSILIGWGIGYFTEMSELTISLLFAILAGSIILNVLKEELPEDRKSNLWAFLAGVIGYTLLLLLL